MRELIIIRGHQRSSEVIRGHQRPSERSSRDEPWRTQPSELLPLHAPLELLGTTPRAPCP